MYYGFSEEKLKENLKYVCSLSCLLTAAHPFCLWRTAGLAAGCSPSPGTLCLLKLLGVAGAGGNGAMVVFVPVLSDEV